jgi:hypothetical protein
MADEAIAAKKAIDHGGAPNNRDYADVKTKQMAEYAALVKQALGGDK